MRKVFAIIVILILVGGSAELQAQKATEIFIPVGYSPGLSGKYTLIGKIETVNTQMRTLTIADSAGTHEVVISDKTHIWLDRSKLKLPNKVGTLADIKSGLLAEVKYENHKRKGPVAWIKVQLTEP